MTPGFKPFTTLENGGLNLTDFELHIKALRMSWIPRLLDEGRFLDILSQI